MRAILIHLNVQPAEEDGRSASEIAEAVGGAIFVGCDSDEMQGLNIEIALAEEIESTIVDTP